MGIIENFSSYMMDFFMLVIHVCFVVVTKKCFFDKYSITRMVVPFFLAPSLLYVAARLLTYVLYLSSANKEKLWLIYVLFFAIVVVGAVIQLLLYIKFVKAKNVSIAAFIYLCCLMFMVYNDIIENSFGISFLKSTMVIGNIIMIFLAVQFYRKVIIPISELSKTRQDHGMPVFVLIPVLAIVIKLILVALFEVGETYMLSGLDIMNVSVLPESLEEQKLHVAEIIIGWRLSLYIYAISSYSILTIFIISFAVIVKNTRNINEISVQKDEIAAARDGIKELSVEVMEALAHTIDAKDKYTNGHSVRVAKYSRMIAERMGLAPETCENIYYMGLLHDIGKIGVPNEIINSPHPLTDQEYDVIKRHPVTGHDILAEIKSRPDLSTGALWHHERYDGKGYPDKLSGEKIPLEARIIAVADSYDAMTSNRSYRRYLSQEVVRSELLKNKGIQFDPQAVETMVAIIDEDKEYLLRETAINQ